MASGHVYSANATYRMFNALGCCMSMFSGVGPYPDNALRCPPVAHTVIEQDASIAMMK